METASELQTDKVLLRSLVIRPPQDLIAQLQMVDPERWANRMDLLAELVDRVMDVERLRTGMLRPDGIRQPFDLPYSYVIHAPDDSRGVESPHAHVIVSAMDRDQERPFNVYAKDIQHTRQVAEHETEQLFSLERTRGREAPVEPERGFWERAAELDIPFHESYGRQAPPPMTAAVPISRRRGGLHTELRCDIAVDGPPRTPVFP